MTNFIYDNTALPEAKVDLNPSKLRTRESTAADWAAVFSALEDLRTFSRGTTFNVRSFGAVGDGVTDDKVAILAAIAAARTTVSGGTGAAVVFPKGTWVTSQKLVCPDGVALVGAGGPGGPVSVIKAHPSFNDTALITNELQVGNQEYSFLHGLLIRGNRGGGAVCSVAVVNWVSLFINSAITNCIIEEGSNVGLRIAAEGTPGGMGPIIVQNCWTPRNTGHNTLIEDTVGNSGAANGILLINHTSEHPGTGKSAIYIKGNGRLSGVHLINTHIELGNSGETAKTGITIDGASDVILDGVQLLTGAPATVSEGIKITNVAQNVRFHVRNVTNNNLINPVLSDLKNGATVAALNLTHYVSPDSNVRGGMRFTPDSASTAKSAAFQNSAGTDRAWFDLDGQLTGSSVNGAGLDVVADSVNGRALAYTNNAKSRAFAWYFPDNSFIRLRYLTGGVECLDINNSGETRFWNLMTLLASIRGSGARAAAPSSGTHVAGEIVFNQDPIATGFIGWVCVTGGTPGTWKSWGVISA